jgi:hypothetical protein
MPKGDSQIKKHRCSDGKVRRVEPVYFRVVNDEGKRVFKQMLWHCYHCGTKDFTLTEDDITGVNDGSGT